MVGAALERVLVGTDGSPAAARGVGWAASLARALGAELVVTAVVDTRSFVGDLGAERSRVAVAVDEEWSEPAGEDLGSHLSTLVLEGDPRTVLPAEAVTQRADVLVLGSGGLGWYPAMHLGHVAHAVAHHSPVPVVIVPPGAAPRAPEVILLGVDGSAGSASARPFFEISPLMTAQITAPSPSRQRRDATRRAPGRTRRGRCRRPWYWRQAVRPAP